MGKNNILTASFHSEEAYSTASEIYSYGAIFACRAESNFKDM